MLVVLVARVARVARVTFVTVGRTGTGLNCGTDSVVRRFTYDVPDKENTREESVENMMHG